MHSTTSLGFYTKGVEISLHQIASLKKLLNPAEMPAFPMRRESWKALLAYTQRWVTPPGWRAGIARMSSRCCRADLAHLHSKPGMMTKI